jgi:hypothetical protein
VAREAGAVGDHSRAQGWFVESRSYGVESRSGAGCFGRASEYRVGGSDYLLRERGCQKDRGGRDGHRRRGMVQRRGQGVRPTLQRSASRRTGGRASRRADGRASRRASRHASDRARGARARANRGTTGANRGVPEPQAARAMAATRRGRQERGRDPPWRVVESRERWSAIGGRRPSLTCSDAMAEPSFPPRLHVILARSAHQAVVIRRADRLPRLGVGRARRRARAVRQPRVPAPRGTAQGRCARGSEAAARLQRHEVRGSAGAVPVRRGVGTTDSLRAFRRR